MCMIVPAFSFMSLVAVGSDAELFVSLRAPPAERTTVLRASAIHGVLSSKPVVIVILTMDAWVVPT